MSEILILDPHEVVVGDRFRPADRKAVEERAQSLAKFGQLQPIIDEPNGPKGERSA